MLPVPLARHLHAAGLRWKPAPGDRFAIPDRDLDDEVFVLSNMVIAVHELPDGPVIGFNGTTEWAMDDLEQHEAIWLPREDQLRELLGGTFHMLERTGNGWRVELTVGDRRLRFEAATAEEAYGEALLDLIRLGVD
ncbi:pilus assembly protein CpaE [Asanoa hainanensis]|uniref:pilus assembly protein CpaE n=1 Tax=Asanoa hainanensis TaxID=560556 RepID=UPI000B79A648|nr:pilus assembly protein CpaE [Asanoa hainanensis]